MQYLLLQFQKFVFREELITVHIKTYQIIRISLQKEKFDYLYSSSSKNTGCLLLKLPFC